MLKGVNKRKLLVAKRSLGFLALAKKLAHHIELSGKDAEHEGEVIQKKGRKAGVSYRYLCACVVEVGDYGDKSAGEQAADCQTQDCPA